MDTLRGQLQSSVCVGHAAIYVTEEEEEVFNFLSKQPRRDPQTIRALEQNSETER